MQTEGHEDLMTRMAAGDRSAFDQVYGHYKALVYRYVLQMGGSPAGAEEVTQETFLILFRKANRFDGRKGTVKAYVLGIARNVFYRQLGWSRRHRSLEEAEEEALTVDADWDPLIEMKRNRDVEYCRRAILSLPEKYREVVVLCDLQEMSYASASNLLGCELGTIRSRLHRGRQLLFQKLQRQAGARAACKPVEEAS